jgi:hypothetical protein
MKTNRKIFLLLAVISIVASGAFAQQKAATTSMQFLKIMPCARATALGDAYSAAATGAEAIFWNPAGLAWTENQEFSFTYIDWIFDAKLYDIAYALPLGNLGNFGMLIQYVDYGNFDEAITSGIVMYPGQSYPYLTGRTFKPYDYVIGLSYARKMTDKFSFGVNAKYAYESLYDKASVTSYAMGQFTATDQYAVDTKRGVILFDAGFHYNTGFRTIKLAASAQNFGPDVKYKATGVESQYPAPLSFRLGTAVDLCGPGSLLWDQENNRIGFMFDLFLANDADQQEHLGIEYEFLKTFAVRAGYKFNYGTESFTFGGGVHQPIGPLNVSIDYSFGKLEGMISDFTGNSHRISVGVGIK